MTEIELKLIGIEIEKILIRHGLTSAILIVKNERSMEQIAVKRQNETESMLMTNIANRINKALNDELKLNVNLKKRYVPIVQPNLYKG